MPKTGDALLIADNSDHDWKAPSYQADPSKPIGGR